MECTGGEEKIQVYKILLYNLLWERDYYRDLDQLSGFFSAGFWERAVRQGKKKGHLSLSQRMGPRAGKSDCHLVFVA